MNYSRAPCQSYRAENIHHNLRSIHIVGLLSAFSSASSHIPRCFQVDAVILIGAWKQRRSAGENCGQICSIISMTDIEKGHEM